MSDIVIKGMELPKDPIDYLHLIIQDGKVHTAISCGHLTTDKLNVADAIEVPTPHGDLVDRQKLIKALSKAWDVDDDQDFANKSVWRIVEKEAQTVIEASTEETK